MHIGREKILGQATKAARIPFTIVRPCAIYGAGDTHNSYGPNRFARTATESGKITLFGNGEEKRHHVFVGDVAEVIRLCIVHGSTGVINAATGKAVSFAEAAGLIARAAGPGVAIEFLPRATAVTYRHFDLSALAQAFPDFRAMPLEKGLAQMTQAMTQAITMPQGELCPR
jgi:UDP-glucose 4-epimerase